MRHLTLGRIGPWLYHPDSDFIDQYEGSASDIAVINTETCPVVSVCHTSGVLLVGLALEAVGPCWLIEPDQPEITPTLHVYEGILISATPSDVKLYQDPITPDTLYVNYLDGVYQVQLGLCKYLNDPLIGFDGIETKAQAVVRRLVDTGEKYSLINKHYIWVPNCF